MALYFPTMPDSKSSSTLSTVCKEVKKEERSQYTKKVEELVL